jgi:hypothetical protein
MAAKRRAKKQTPQSATDAPKLLSGGNPQIPKGDGPEPVRAYIAAMPGWKRAVGGRIDALAEACVPDVQRAVRWNSPFYGIEGQGWFLSLHCFTHYVKLTFLNGGQLEPLPPEASKYPAVRSLHLREGDDLEDPQLEAWMRQAARLPGDKLF